MLTCECAFRSLLRREHESAQIRWHPLLTSILESSPVWKIPTWDMQDFLTMPNVYLFACFWLRGIFVLLILFIISLHYPLPVDCSWTSACKSYYDILPTEFLLLSWSPAPQNGPGAWWQMALCLWSRISCISFSSKIRMCVLCMVLGNTLLKWE